MNNHHNREDLAGEHIFGDMGQLVLFLLFVGVWITDSFFLHFSDLYSAFLPLTIRIILSVILFVISIYLAKSGMRIVFGEIRAEPAVIREGVFGLVRHPIYLSVILFYAALLILKCSLAAVFIWMITILFYHYISRHEEKLLLDKFGRDYEQYKRDVPMWLPGLKKKTN